MIFTIDVENNISVFGTQEEAAASTTNPFELFTSPKELTQLAGTWPAERLVAIWNSLPGVKPVKGFKTAKAGASKIWDAIQGLGKAAEPAPEPAKPKGGEKAKGTAQAAKGAPAKGKATKKAIPAKAAPKAKKAAKKEESAGPRRAAKPLKWSPCSSARTVPRWWRLWKRWAGKSTRSGALWPAR